MKFGTRHLFVWVTFSGVLCCLALIVAEYYGMSVALVTSQAELTYANKKLSEVQNKCLREIHGKQIIEAFFAKVVDVIDGDSIKVVNESNEKIRIRLDSIDCPELEQAFGNEARSRLIELVHGEKVEIQISQQGQNQVTRAFVVVDSLDVSLTLVQEGLAWNEISYSWSEKFGKAEDKAKAARFGLWQDHCPCSPWQFRLGSHEKVALPKDYDIIRINIEMWDTMGLLEVGDVVDIYQNSFVGIDPRKGWTRKQIASAVQIVMIDEFENGVVRVSVVSPRRSAKEILSASENGGLRLALIPIPQDD
jgi:endonuclease YncB( thermonuclease family)